MEQPRIVVIGAGAVGGYVGGLLSRAGHAVTLVDPWPEHVEAIRRHGLGIEGMTPEESVSIPVKALHLTNLQGLSKRRPVDIAFVAVKSYDTDWVTTMIRPFLSEAGYVVSLRKDAGRRSIS